MEGKMDLVNKEIVEESNDIEKKVKDMMEKIREEGSKVAVSPTGVFTYVTSMICNLVKLHEELSDEFQKVIPGAEVKTVLITMFNNFMVRYGYPYRILDKKEQDAIQNLADIIFNKPPNDSLH